MRITKTDVIGMSERELYDLDLLLREEKEKRVERRKTALGKISDNMKIEDAEGLIGCDLYWKFIEESKIYEVGDRVRFL